MSLRPKVVDFNGVFEPFRQGLQEMYLFSDKAVQGMDMYQQVYDLCTARPKAFVEELLQGIVQFLLEHAAGVERTVLSHDDIVTAYAAEWNKYQTASDYANRVCDFLNRHFLKKAATHKSAQVQRVMRLSIEGHAFLVWKQRILSNIKRNHANALIFQLMTLIRRERDGNFAPSEVMQKCIMSLVDVNAHSEQPLLLYVEEFETPFIARTVAYYTRESNAAMSTLSISEFMDKALSRLDEEEQWSKRYCHPSTLQKAKQAVESAYIAAHQSKIQSEFERMILEDRFEDCTKAYMLLNRIPDGVANLIDTYERYVTRVGKEAISRFDAATLKDPREYVEVLIRTHAKYMAMCATVFKNDAAFVAAVDKAFRVIVNNNDLGPSASPPEVFARYCDLLLKKSPKAASPEGDFEERLGKMIALFKYIDDKDVFQKFYSRALAKRLIQSASISDDAEVGMISRLKAACGYEYTSKLQRMLTDITLSSDLSVLFKTFIDKSSSKLGLDFQINVLTTGSWPIMGGSMTEFQLPVELEQSAVQFSSFYSNHYSGRRLTWLHHLSKGDVRYNGNDKRYELSMTLYQMAVLLLFNDTATLTLQDIEAHTKIGKVELSRILKGFTDIKLLVWTDASNEGSTATASISVNDGFASKRTKIKIAAGGSAVEQKQENEATRKAVDEDRRLYLQACIVRIMKSRQELSHTMLVQEVINQSKARFSPSVAMIKRCIEQLIEKHYIDRQANERDRYVYVS
ncbi:Cullin [Entophlyctis helioformis]|nr:Cullin [Entophlyctis helioformis]